MADPQMPPTSNKSRSVWMWLGCGCGAFLLLAGLMFGGFIWVVVHQAHQTEEMTHDPVRLARAVQAVVPYKELPSGYRPVGTFSLPFVLDLAIFADRDLQQYSRGTGQHLPPEAKAFVVIRTLSFLGHHQNTDLSQPGLSGDNAPPWIKELGLSVASNDLVSRGSLQIAGHTATYRTVRMRKYRGGEHWSNLTAVMVINCGDSHWLHSVAWSVPAPPSDNADFKGTPADPEAITAMATHFDICGGGAAKTGS
jgi:hypothetical protein